MLRTSLDTVRVSTTPRPLDLANLRLALAGTPEAIVGLYELHARPSNLSAERHHRRSSRFFYGMLAAQLGVIVATLAMAAQQRNLRRAIAVAFTVYVLLNV